MSSILPARAQGVRLRIDEAIRSCAPPRDPVPTCAHAAYWRLIDSLRSASPLLSPTSLNLDDARQICWLCKRLSFWESSWERPPESWSPQTSSGHLMLRGFTQYVLDRYPVPNHLTKVWYTEPFSLRDEVLYTSLARGESVRTVKFGGHLGLNKQAAKFFMMAPDDATVQQAVRYAQSRAEGCSPSRGRALMKCLPEVSSEEAEKFWIDTIRFIARLDWISITEIRQIIEFCINQRFTPSYRVVGQYGGNVPLQPNLSLKGWTLRSVRRKLVQWENERKQLKQVANHSKDAAWQPSKIVSHAVTLGDEVWSIEEILTPRMLQLEAKIQNNCVMSYLHRCARRRTSLWSMSVCIDSRRYRKVTIEVDALSMSIRQAKGKHNRNICENERKILKAWARKAELSGLE